MPLPSHGRVCFTSLAGRSLALSERTSRLRHGGQRPRGTGVAVHFPITLVLRPAGNSNLHAGEVALSKVSNASTSMALAVFAVVAAIGATGVAGSPNVPPTAVPAACTVPHHPGPGYNASITNQQNGHRVCIGLGEKLLVFLSAPSPQASAWRQITAAPPGILRVAPLSLMLPKGVTATNFLAERRGVVQITSERSACGPAPPGGATCDVILLWRATVVVQAQYRPS